MEDQHERMEKYYTCIRESGLKIHTLVQVKTSPSDRAMSTGEASRGVFGAGTDLEIRTIGVCLPQSGTDIYIDSKGTKANK